MWFLWKNVRVSLNKHLSFIKLVRNTFIYEFLITYKIIKLFTCIDTIHSSLWVTLKYTKCCTISSSDTGSMSLWCFGFGNALNQPLSKWTGLLLRNWRPVTHLGIRVGVPLQQLSVTRVTYSDWPSGGWQRHRVIAATVTKYVTTMPTVVSPAGNAEFLLTETTVTSFLVWSPLSIAEGFAHIPKVCHLQLGLRQMGSKFLKSSLLVLHSRNQLHMCSFQNLIFLQLSGSHLIHYILNKLYRDKKSLCDYHYHHQRHVPGWYKPTSLDGRYIMQLFIFIKHSSCWVPPYLVSFLVDPMALHLPPSGCQYTCISLRYFHPFSNTYNQYKSAHLSFPRCAHSKALFSPPQSKDSLLGVDIMLHHACRSEIWGGSEHWNIKIL